MLAQAGFPNGFSEVTVLPLDDAGNVMLDAEGEKVPLTLFWMPTTRPYNPDGEGIGQAMAADLAAIGINVQLENAGDWATYLDRRRNGELIGLYQLGWTGDNGDPDNFFFLRGCSGARAGGQNITKWCNKEFDELLVKARSTSDMAARTAAYEKMQVIMKEEAPDMTIAHSIVNDAAAANLTGYKMSPLGGHHFKGVDLQ